mmetsp:Transcript_68151/g.134550  ORF Transcript_68151/g.134550 Transcript_68151/m.134550 type:complete len:380 (+) Transcript_68151:51-1190(+)
MARSSAHASVAVVALVIHLGTCGDVESNAKEVAVVAYLPEWRYEGANWETISEHVTHLLLFSLEMSAEGAIRAQDRIPRRELLEQARNASRRHGTELLLCFGGNGRSDGFSPVVRSKKALRRFLKSLGRLMDELGLDGVDYNWEYPGYQFGRGYLAEEEVQADYKGLAQLVRGTKKFFPNKTVTMAYYPDTRQETLLKQHGIDQVVDLMHMMSYDAGGEQHSSWTLGKKSVDQGKEVLPPRKLTMGVPFYGRHSGSGDWTTYEDLVQRHDPLPPTKDSVLAPADQGGSKYVIGFNGVKMIERKTRYALEQGAAGVMIWEVGQDCRLVPVTHGKKTHVRTCPKDESSLLLAITRAIEQAGFSRMRRRDWQATPQSASDEL